MDKTIRRVVRAVLKAASNKEHFFDYSDAERLNWMIAKAYIVGRRSGLRQRSTQHRVGTLVKRTARR